MARIFSGLGRKSLFDGRIVMPPSATAQQGFAMRSAVAIGFRL
jgi:hypothetical protein